MNKYIVALNVEVTVEAMNTTDAERIAWRDAWKLIGTPHAATVTQARVVREER